MTTLKAIALALVIALVGALLVGIQQYRVLSLKGEVTVANTDRDAAIGANAESQATITTLRAEAARNVKYRADLAQRIKVSEAKATKAVKNFEKLKRDKPAVRTWADQPLPDGLRGKAASGDKDNSGKN
jgi:LysB family phage lysis regulatory protein